MLTLIHFDAQLKMIFAYFNIEDGGLPNKLSLSGSTLNLYSLQRVSYLNLAMKNVSPRFGEKLLKILKKTSCGIKIDFLSTKLSQLGLTK